MRLETRAQRAFWVICALLAALLLASPGASQAPDDSDASPTDSAVEGKDDDAEDSDAEEEDDSAEADSAGVDDEPAPEGGVDQELLRGAAVEDLDIEEILVEGTQTEGLAEVPIAVTQFSATDIQNLRIQNVADLAAYTPNLEINTAFAASNPTLFIRGIGLKDYNSNSSGAVGIWQDGIQMNSPAAQLFSLFDVASIEVFRGPQGSDRGRNATAGAIHLHSAEPDGDWGGWGSFTYGNYNDIEFEGGIGFPIFPDVFNDTLSGRIAFSAGFRDGYLKNTCADWDPTEHGIIAAGEENSLALYAALDPTPTAVDVAPAGGPPEADRFLYLNTEVYNQLRDPAGDGTFLDIPGAMISAGDGSIPPAIPGSSIFRYENPDNPGVFDLFAPHQQDDFTMEPDSVCILSPPGNVVTNAGVVSNAATPNPDPARTEAGVFIDNTRALKIEDFDGLKHRLNNVKYWAGRGMLRFEPNDSLDFLFIAHWGQNRGDSFHLQTVGASNFNQNVDLGVVEEGLGYYQRDAVALFDERLVGPKFEATKEKRGRAAGLLGNLP